MPDREPFTYVGEPTPPKETHPMTNEPVITVATITGIATAVIALLVAFNVPLSDDQQKALIGVVAVVAPLVAAFVARRKVSPVATKRAIP